MWYPLVAVSDALIVPFYLPFPPWGWTGPPSLGAGKEQTANQKEKRADAFMQDKLGVMGQRELLFSVPDIELST